MRLLRSLGGPCLIAALLLATFACSGGGCSGCAGCGIGPIPGGFPLAERIPNAAQVRLASSGIAFIEDHLREIIPIFLPGGLDFPVERSDQSIAILCSTDPVAGDGITDCFAHVDVESVDLQPVEGTNQLTAYLRVAAESRDATGEAGPWVVRVLASDCLLTIDTHGGSRSYVGVGATVALGEVTQPARAGYTRLAIDSVGVSDGEGVEADDFSITSRYWWDGGPIACGIANLLRPTIAGTIQGAVEGLLRGALEDQLCTLRGELGCPTDTFDRGETATDATCFFDPAPPAEGPDECVPSLLGLEGRGDLGASILGGFAPGAHGPAQLVLAAGGDAEAVNDGMSIFLAGGFMSLDRTLSRTPAHHPCVPRVEPPLPDVARASPFRSNFLPGTSTPTHLGIGISEDYLDHAGYGMFDSGMLCIGAGTRLTQQLSTGLVSAVAGSIRSIAFPANDAPLTIALRPQRPPDFTVGTSAGEPLLTIALPDLQMDFYVWSTERYVRVMTFETDLTIELQLTVEGGRIVPRIENVVAESSEITNSELLTESPETVARAVETVVSSFAGMLAGAIAPISLPDIMGFELDVPSAGLQGIAADDERFVGLFANLRLASAAIVSVVDTELRVDEVSLDRSSMSLEHWGEERNGAWLSLTGRGGPPGAEYEHSYRIDGMTWSHWSSAPHVWIEDEVLLLQARHVIEARSRIVGDEATADPTPARAELLIDVLPPDLVLERDGDEYVARASDLISPEPALRHRFRVAGGGWSEWQESPRFAPPSLSLRGGELEVEVEDESANVARASLPLGRIVARSVRTGGCSAGVASGRASAFVIAMTVLAMLAVRRRR